MKQEHRFVAELYRYLAPFVDTDHDVFLSLDGIAARSGVNAGVFIDPDVPDIWVRFVGSQSHTLLEAKVLNDNHTVTLVQGQLVAWRSNGNGSHRPSAWVATNRQFTLFYYWEHIAFAQNLDRSRSQGDYPRIRIPDNRSEFDDLRQLALHVLRVA